MNDLKKIRYKLKDILESILIEESKAIMQIKLVKDYQ